MADAKQQSHAATPIETPGNDSTSTKNATSALSIPGIRGTEAKSSLWCQVLSFVWNSADGDPEYRRYVQRLDLFLL